MQRVCFAVACFVVFATHVHLGFERIRIRVVTAPQVASELSLTVPLPDLSRLAGSPAAIIARLRGADEATRLTMAFDATPLTSREVPAHDQTRVDTSAIPSGGEDHTLTLTGDRAGWQLDYLEIANVHGFSDGVLGFVIVPRGHPGHPEVPWWLAALVAAGLVTLRPSPDGPSARAWRALWWVGIGLALLVFGVVLLADVVSPYKILLSPVAFFLAAAFLYAWPLSRGIARLLAWLRSVGLLVSISVGAALRRGAVATYRKGWLARIPHLAVVMLVLWGVARFYDPRAGFTVFIMFGSEFEPQAVPALKSVPHAVDSPYGYDAQFYAQLAFDPLLQDPATAQALDSPSYRARRIFLPWLANVLGLGLPWTVLQVYALLNVASWLVLAWLLLRWLPPGSSATTAAWIACVLGHGLMASMRLAMPDGPSALLIALGVAAMQANRQWLAAAVLGVAGLTRETNLLAGAMVPPSDKPNVRRMATFVAQGAMVVAPLGLWMAYLGSLGLPVDSAGEGNFALPFSFYVQKWMTSLRDVRLEEAGPDAWFTVLALVALTTQAAALVWWRAWRNPWWRVGMSYTVLMFVLGPAVWDGQPGAVTRVVIPMTLAFNVLLPRDRWFWPLWALGNANLLHGPMALGFDWFPG